MAFTFDDISINTIIGPDSFVSGDVKINGFIRVDGSIDGQIETNSNVIIGDKAKVKGNISASAVIVGGIVLGDIKAPNGIKLLSNSVVLGNLSTKSLQIEDGVLFNGHCISLKDETEYKSSTSRFLDALAIRSKVLK